MKMIGRTACSLMVLSCVSAFVGTAVGQDYSVHIGTPAHNPTFTYSSTINVSLAGTVKSSIPGDTPPVETVYIAVYRYNTVTNQYALLATYTITPTVVGNELSWSQNYSPPQPVAGTATDQFSFTVHYSDQAISTGYFKVRRPN